MADYRIDAGFAGSQADMQHADFISVVAANDINAGQPVDRGTNEGEGDVAAGGDFLGIAVGDSTHGTFAKGSTVRVGVAGTFWVEVADSVSAGDEVSYKDSSGEWSNKTSAGYTIVDRAVYETDATSGTVAKVRFNPHTVTAGA